jgi:hypothetical protein
MCFPACSEQLAEQVESVPSVDNLEFVMESLALGHTVLDQKMVRAAALPPAEAAAAWQAAVPAACPAAGPGP